MNRRIDDDEFTVWIYNASTLEIVAKETGETLEEAYETALKYCPEGYRIVRAENRISLLYR